MSGAEDLARLTVTIDIANELFLSDEVKTIDVGGGVMRSTNAKVLADLSIQMSGALIYTSTTLGIAGTQSGGYFSVASDNDDVHVDLYRNDAGVAAWVSSYPSTEYLEKVDSKFFSTNTSGTTVVPVATTEDGKVPIWLESGMLGAVNLTPDLRKEATKEVVARYPGADPLLLPLMVSNYGQVVLWLENGRVNAAGLEATVSAQVQSSLDAYEAQAKQKVTDGSSLYSYRAKIANIKAGNGFARVFLTGDSWAEHLAETAEPLAASLYEQFGQSGQGWISVHADEGGASSTVSQLLNGARLVKSSGWTIADMTLAADSLDGHAALASGVVDTITVSNLKAQSLKWYYLDGGGAFRYSVDGAAPITVTCANTGARKSVDISGLSDSAHSFIFDLVGNTGSVVMYGGMASRSSPGVEFSKAGNGGSTAVQWNVISPKVQAYISELKPDVAIVILGTNDRNQSVSKSSFKTGIETLVTAYRTGNPHCSVVLITPAAGGSSAELGLIRLYADAMSEVSKTFSGVEHIDLNEFMPPRVVTDQMGLWSDSNHLSAAGGRFVSSLLMKYFFNV